MPVLRNVYIQKCREGRSQVSDSLGAGVRCNFELNGCCESNSGPLQEPHMFLTAEPSSLHTADAIRVILKI